MYKARIFFLFFAFLFVTATSGFSQTLIVKWDFPNNPDDSIADGGIPANLGKYIGTRGGTGPVAFGYQGYTTQCAGAQKWTNGAYVKYWQIEFTTLQYAQLTLTSKQLSFHPSYYGPRDFLVQYCIGSSGTWITIDTISIKPGNIWDVLGPIPLPDTCNNQPSVYIRWLMYTNTTTQGPPHEVRDIDYNKIDDVIISSGCTIPTVTAAPASQTICPGASITPIVITNPNNITGTTFSWKRDNTTVLTGIPASGSGTTITGKLNSSTPQTFVTTTFTITANSGGCFSTTTATVTVGDNSPPVFLVNPPVQYFCVQDIVLAFWNFAGDITPIRPDWYTWQAGQTTFDLNPASFSDNCTAPANLILHWKINLVGGTSITGTGQISLYPQSIIFPLGTNTITYWLEDAAGNLTPLSSRPVKQVIVLPRPVITRNF